VQRHDVRALEELVERADRRRVPERELRAAMTGPSGLHAILDVVIEGQKTVHPSILADYQQDPIRGTISHIDLREVRMDQPIHATVTIQLIGEPAGVKTGGMLSLVAREVTARHVLGEDSRENIGPAVMGRNMFGPIGGGAWGDEQWTGWWGDDPPYHYPVFILTHHPRDPVEMEGGTTFHFVTDGIESALEQAREAAGGKDVMLWGGGQVAQQYLAAGLLDELELHVVPVVLGDGARLFDNLGDAEVQLEQVRAVEAPGVTHLKYRVVT